MGIVEVLASEIEDSWGIDVRRLLQIYESAYPPDLALKMGEEPSAFDFDVFGGDIGVSGFYINSSFQSLIQRASQDLLIRILTDRNTSRLFPSVGNRNVMTVPREGISSTISIAVAESPFIDTLDYVNVRDGDVDEIIIDISATTITGDSIHIGFNF